MPTVAQVEAKLDKSVWSGWTRQLHLNGIYINTGGDIAGDMHYGCSGFIPVNHDYDIMLKGRGEANWSQPSLYIALFDSCRQFIPCSVNRDVNQDEGKYHFWVNAADIPANAAFYVISYPTELFLSYANSTTMEQHADAMSRLVSDIAKEATQAVAGIKANKEKLTALQQRLDALEGTSLSDAIDNVREVEAFLAGIADTETLTGLLTDLHNKTKAELASGLQQKQDSLTTSEDLSISDANVLSLTERAKQRLFDDMWLKAVGTYGSIDHTHVENGKAAPYYLNELWLTYDEALAVDRGSREFASTGTIVNDCKTIYPINLEGTGWGGISFFASQIQRQPPI